MELNMTLLPTAIRAYVYHPLTDGCVRFLELFSDTTDAPLRCRIFTSYLNDTPLYEALSYVWGQQEPLYDSQCSDVSAGVLRIGPNLHNALLHLLFSGSAYALYTGGAGKHLCGLAKKTRTQRMPLDVLVISTRVPLDERRRLEKVWRSPTVPTGLFSYYYAWAALKECLRPSKL